MPTQTATSTMKAVQVGKKGGPFEVVEKEIPQPGPGQVRLRVEACGICHSDLVVKEGFWPGITYPRSPGHEIAGRIDAVGAGATQWTPGQRAGVGWHGGHCFTCDACRRGDFILCKFEKITAIHFDGGYAEYVVVPAEAVAAIPEGLSAEDAAPLMCAGITVFNALRNSGARPGDVVAVQGIGGLGHLGVQYAGGAKTRSRWPNNWERDSTSIPRGQTGWPSCRSAAAPASLWPPRQMLNRLSR